ncbi:MAG: FAD:protein FMN transferase [Pirellulaceae bacterium]|jgi:thiamine biosynthesis lipoprotein|nr:FAD:protein FMN transferase [Pirellulaceae bacterium]MDP7018185.1 FAD:protein FMN transferase [Pirellulaceae bacterium]
MPNLFLLIALGSAPIAADGELQRFEAAEVHMGARFSITVYAPDQPAAEAAVVKAFERVEQLNSRLSDYLPESELNRLCRESPHADAQVVSADLFRVLRAAAQVNETSGGAFDVTVGPITRIWRKARRDKRLPDKVKLETALRAVGQRHVQLVGETRVKLTAPKMQLDLGGIAKGFAADEALAVLREAGLSRALVNAGGDIVVGDAPPDRAGWRIGVAPLSRGAKPSEVVTLTNGAVATSGDAWQFVELDGVRYSHIVDPQTGVGLTLRSSVTVVARDGMTADAYASAVSVLGPEKGMRLAEGRRGVSTLLVYERDKKVHIQRSADFPDTTPAMAP